MARKIGRELSRSWHTANRQRPAPDGVSPQGRPDSFTPVTPSNAHTPLRAQRVHAWLWLAPNCGRRQVMPQRPSRPCRHRLCRAIHRNANGYCDQHQADASNSRRTSAGTYKSWYTEARWRSLRKSQLSAEPLCAFCKEAGCITEATICDHIEPHGGDRVKFWVGPFQSLCKKCHDSTKQSMDHGVASMYPEWLKPASCRLTIVFGPPGSGKSYYIKQHSQPSDVVIDLDEIKAELSGKPIYQAGDEWVGPAIRERNRLLGELCKLKPAQRVWFITTGKGYIRRQWWVDKLKPTEVVLMDTPIDVCERRINADGRRPEGLKRAHKDVLRSWS